MNDPSLSAPRPQSEVGPDVVEHHRISTWVPSFLRWSRRLFFVTGALALGYVGFTLLDAKLYQVSARRSLEAQIHLDNVRYEPQVRPAVKTGDVLGRVDIPRLGMSVVILQGSSSRQLRLGAGHIEGTVLPGEAGNSGIAGHRDTFFRNLKDIRTRDEIQLQTTSGLFRYEVDWMKVVEPNDTSVLEPSTLGSTITLVTCYPFYLVGSSPRRFIVRAHKL
jgi:sortase A